MRYFWRPLKSKDNLFPESETYAVVQVVHKSRFEPIELHFEAFHKGVQIQGLAGLKEIFCEGELLEVGAYDLNRAQARGNGFYASRHLNASDLLPGGRIGIDGTRGLTTRQRFLDVS